MKNRILLFLIFLAISFLIPHPSSASTVQVKVIHSQDKYPLKGAYPILLRVKISKPWYIHSTKKDSSYIIPTVLSFNESPGLKVEGVRFPQPETRKFDYTPDPIEVFSGEVLVEATLRVSENAALGGQVIKGQLSFQACSSKVCLPPEQVTINISTFIVPQGTQTKALNQNIFLSAKRDKRFKGGLPGVRPGAGFWLTLLGIFLGGLALNLTPCIYPLIPITVSYFSGRSRKVSAHNLVHGILYILGLALTNSVLGLSASLSGGLLGSALQHPFVLIFVALIMVVLALSFFGFWEFRIPQGMTRVGSKTYGGYFGTFFIGLTLGIVAAPCLGPFILGLLTYVSQKGDPFLGFLYFFILSIGLGLPLAVLAIFSGSIDKLPMSGDWLVWVRRFMGWVLMGMAAYMISPLVPHHLAKSGLLAAVAIAAGAHLGWFERTGSALPGFSRFKKFFGVILVGGGIIYLVSAGYDYEKEGIKWVPYDHDLKSTAVEKKKPLILDFYADWCAPCVAMDRKVFKNPEVVQLSRHFITMRLDLTRRQPFQKDVLSQYGVRGVPTVIFLNREGKEERALRVEYLVSKSEFLDRMRRFLKKWPPLQE